MSLVTEETDGVVRTLGLNRPEKRNAFNVAMLEELSGAYDRAEADANVRAILLCAHGPVFTAGLDLMDVFPRLGEGASRFAEAAMDPWGTHGGERTKPVVTAIHGKCLTLGIELALAGDVVFATEDATFAQIEIARGIFSFGGRHRALDHRRGVGQRHAVPADRGRAGCARGPPLGPLAEARALARGAALRAAAAKLLPEIVRLAATADAREGVAAFIEKRTPRFQGR